MSFFAVTDEEIKEATSNGKAVFTDKEEYTFQINELKEKDGDKGPLLIVQTKVVGGPQDGKPHAFFINDSIPAQKNVWINILQALYTPEEIKNGVEPSSLMSRQIKSMAKQNGQYFNFYKFTEVGGAPDVGGDATDIPF